MKENAYTNEPVQLTVALPLKGHDGTTLRNLIHMIHARGDLINQAIGTRFRVDGGLIGWLAAFDHTRDLDTLFKAVETYEAEFGKAADGLEVHRDRIAFSTLPETTDPILIRTFATLCAMMNKKALAMRSVSPEATDTGNAKADMLHWLREIGMGGEEFKAERNMLTFLLPGFIERV